ncbi:MAG: hypothetical protein ACYCWE_04365 [Eubacteriales bacterium]
MITSDMPQIDFGKHSVSRLIVGANTMNGGSHLSRFVNMQMKRYFTPEKILEHLNQCQNSGINTWQSISGNLNWYRMIQEQGVNMHFISLGWDTPDEPNMLENLASAGTIGIAHHGEYTDACYKNGKIHLVEEYCKKVRDKGMMVGVSTHMPDVLKHILDADWDVDFFMCCVYERHRTREELMKLLGDVPIPISEVYLENDPPRMYSIMRQTKKPCFAFKILAAGRLCENQKQVEQAFKETFMQIKPNDAVIVGMYPEYEDQVALNIKYVKQFSHLSGKYGI